MHESSKGIASDEQEHDARKVAEESKNRPTRIQVIHYFRIYLTILYMVNHCFILILHNTGKVCGT